MKNSTASRAMRPGKKRYMAFLKPIASPTHSTRIPRVPTEEIYFLSVELQMIHRFLQSRRRPLLGPLVGASNQKKALVEAVSVIVKTNCENQWIICSSKHFPKKSKKGHKSTKIHKSPINEANGRTYF